MKYARRVLLAHLLALAVVIAVVVIAAKEMYDNTRELAERQARNRQELLAAQTARGIESYYTGILAQLDLLRQSEAGERVPLLDSRRPGAQALFLAPILWRQLEGRASHLFAVDRGEQLSVITSFTNNDSVTAEQIVEQMGPWLREVAGPAVSPFEVVGGLGLNLICQPVEGEQKRLLVAAVPVRQIEAAFLDDVNKEQAMSATLLDDTTTMMATSDRALIGKRVSQHLEDSGLRDIVQQVTSGAERRTMMFDRPMKIAGITLTPRLVTAEPIILPGRTWYVFIASQMSEVDGVISNVFRKAMWWAIFVVVSMTAILVSTAVQMIRGRVRLERIKSDLLHRELNQAREIQLHWLPNSSLSIRLMDIAAINEPASHISGDFYNWFELPDGRTVVMIGDVTGHGMSAAFLMATTQLLVRTTMPRVLDPGKCLEEVNRQLCYQVFNGQFVTMLILVLDVEGASVEVATAGHPPPLMGDGESFQPMSIEPQLVLGVERDTTYPTLRSALSPRSSLVMYTDGVQDAQAPNGDRFDVEGLQRCLYGRYDSAKVMLDAVISAINQFRGSRSLADDATLVAIQLQGAGDRPGEPHEIAITV